MKMAVLTCKTSSMLTIVLQLMFVQAILARTSKEYKWNVRNFHTIILLFDYNNVIIVCYVLSFYFVTYSFQLHWTVTRIQFLLYQRTPIWHWRDLASNDKH